MATKGKTIGQILFETITAKRPPIQNCEWTSVAPIRQEEWEIVAEGFMQAWDEQKHKLWQEEYEYDRDNTKNHGKWIERLDASARNHEQRLDGLSDTVVRNESTLNTVLAVARQHEAGLAEHSASLRVMKDSLGSAVDRLTQVEVGLEKLREAMP